MAEKEIYLSSQKLKEIFPLDDHVYMMKYLRDNHHTDRKADEFGRRRSSSYRKRVIKKLVDKGFTVAPNFIRGQDLRFEDPNVQIRIDGTVRVQTPGPYAYTFLSVWAQQNGYTRHLEFMFDKDGNKYMCLAWKAYPTRIEVMTNKGLMFADPNGVLRDRL